MDTLEIIRENTGATRLVVCRDTAQRALQNLPKNPTLPKNLAAAEPVTAFILIS
jgi:pantoate kinase